MMIGRIAGRGGEIVTRTRDQHHRRNMRDMTIAGGIGRPFSMLSIRARSAGMVRCSTDAWKRAEFLTWEGLKKWLCESLNNLFHVVRVEVK